MIVGKSQEYFYWSYSLLALALSWVSSVLPAYLVARRELHDEAAQLLLPKPPVKGSKILLERLSFIWSRLRFTHKVTARNIFRYKQRMLMTILELRVRLLSYLQVLAFSLLLEELSSVNLNKSSNTR